MQLCQRALAAGVAWFVVWFICAGGYLRTPAEFARSPLRACPTRNDGKLLRLAV